MGEDFDLDKPTKCKVSVTLPGFKKAVYVSAEAVTKLEVIRSLVSWGYIERGSYNFDILSIGRHDPTMLYEGTFTVRKIKDLYIKHIKDEPTPQEIIDKKKRLLQNKRRRFKDKLECKQEIENLDIEELKHEYP